MKPVGVDDISSLLKRTETIHTVSKHSKTSSKKRTERARKMKAARPRP